MDSRQTDEFLSRITPSRQKQAREFLAGRSPARCSATPRRPAPMRSSWVEDEDTVRRLANGGRKRSTDAGRARPAPYMQPAGAYASAVRLLFALRVKRSLSTM